MDENRISVYYPTDPKKALALANTNADYVEAMLDIGVLLDVKEAAVLDRILNLALRAKSDARQQLARKAK